MTPPNMVRRLIPSLMVSAVCAVVLGGVATATDDNAPAPSEVGLPKEFGVAMPRLGDSWGYNMTLSGAWTFGLDDDVRLGKGSPYGSFQWAEAGRVRGGDGRMHDANLLLSDGLVYNPVVWYEVEGASAGSGGNGTAIRAENPFWRAQDDAAWFLAGAGTIVQSGVSSRENWTQTDYGIAAGIGAQVRQAQSSYDYVEFPVDFSHCLAVNALQGTNVSLPGSFEIFRACRFGGPHFIDVPAGLRFTAKGVDTVDGIEAVRFQGSRNGTFSAWFNPAIPYPIRFSADLASAEDQEDYDGYYHLPGERSVVLDLVGYKAGKADLDATDDATNAGAAPALRYAERLMWGMDDSDVEHPFRLSDAYNAAWEDRVFADLRTYVMAHPGAYVAAAQYRERMDGDTMQRTWEIGVTDGGYETYDFSVTQTDYSTLLPEALRQQPITAISYGYGYPCCDWDQAPRAKLLPPQMPTVDSLAERWAAFDGSGTPFNAWGFSFGCAVDESPCPKADLTLYAGHTYDDWGYGGLQGYIPTDPFGANDFAYIDRVVTFEADGTARMMQNMDERSETTPVESGPVPSPPTGGSSPEIGPVASTIEVVPARSWMPPADKAAGIGLFALAAGALYWVFPKLKALALLGLFSRVQGDQLLEHPARQNLLNLIEAQPGIHLNELGRKSGLPNGTLTHHLEKLRGAGIIVARPMGGYTCYFGRGTRTDPGAAALKSPGARQILETLRSNPGLSNLELAQATGLQPSTVNYHVQKLAAAGLVGSMRAGRSVRLHALAA